MVPKQFGALMDRHNAEQMELDYRAGVQAALIANSIPSTKKRKAAQPADFFPRLKRKAGGK